MEDRGWDQVDFVYVTGDAYVDHSSFGTAIISRLLESRGYKVGIIPQPDWRRKESIAVFGEPRLGFLVSAPTFSAIIRKSDEELAQEESDAKENPKKAKKAEGNRGIPPITDLAT